MNVFGGSHWGSPFPRMTAPGVQGDDRFRAAPRDDEMTGMGAKQPDPPRLPQSTLNSHCLLESAEQAMNCLTVIMLESA